MPTLLHVAVSPLNEQSYSARIGAAFVDAWQQANPDGEVDHFNLWAEPLPAFDAVGASWKMKAFAGQAPDDEEALLFQRVKAVTDRFLAADRYLFAVPMWNLSIPYPLKHFIDVIVQPGLTFGYDPDRGAYGMVPAERPVQLVLSRGNAGYTNGGPMAAYDHQEPYLRTVLGFIGLTDVRSIVAEGTAAPPDMSEAVLARGIAEAQEAASAF